MFLNIVFTITTKKMAVPVVLCVEIYIVSSLPKNCHSFPSTAVLEKVQHKT